MGSAIDKDARGQKHASPPFLGGLLWRTSVLFVDRMLVELAALGHRNLTRVHVKVFPFLNAQGFRLTQVAEQLQTSKQALSKVIDDLESFGYLSRVPDEGDGRAKVIMLTEAGRALVRDGAKVRDQMEALCIAALPEADRPRIHATLAQLAETLAAGGKPDGSRG